MPEITSKLLPPLPLGVANDTALRGVPAPPRFSLPADPVSVPAPAGDARPEASGKGPVVRDDKNLREATQQFEAFFVGYLLKTMRKGTGEGGVIPTSEGEKIFRDMLDDETARNISTAGHMGIADILYRELGRKERKDNGAE